MIPCGYPCRKKKKTDNRHFAGVGISFYEMPCTLCKQILLEVIIVIENRLFCFFPPPISSCSHTIFKFGYRPYMKVEEILFLLWLPARTCCRNLANEGHVFHKNPLYVLKSYSSGQTNVKICQRKRVLQKSNVHYTQDLMSIIGARCAQHQPKECPGSTEMCLATTKTHLIWPSGQ